MCAACPSTVRLIDIIDIKSSFENSPFPVFIHFWSFNFQVHVRPALPSLLSHVHPHHFQIYKNNMVILNPLCNCHHVKIADSLAFGARFLTSWFTNEAIGQSAALEEFHPMRVKRWFGEWKPALSQSTYRRINATILRCGNAHHWLLQYLLKGTTVMRDRGGVCLCWCSLIEV